MSRKSKGRPVREFRRQRRTRVLLVPLVLLALLLVVHAPASRRVAMQLLARALSSAAGGHVTLASLDYRLLSGHVEAGGLRLVRPGLDLACGRVRIDYTPWSGLRAHLTQPRLTVDLPLGAGAGPPAEGGQPWLVLLKLASLDVTGGTVRLQAPGGRRWLAFENIALQSRRARNAVHVNLGVAAVEAMLPDRGWRGPASLALDATITESTGRLVLSSVRIQAADALLQGEGTIARTGPFVARGRGTVSAGAGLVGVFLPGTEIAGSLAARFELATNGGRPTGTVTLDGRSIRVGGVGPLDARAQGRLDGSSFTVERFDVAGYGGTADASGRLGIDEGTIELASRVHSLDLTQVLRHFPQLVPLASRADADITLRAPHWPTEGMRGVTARAAVTFRAAPRRGLPLAGSARIRLANGELSVVSADLQARDARLHVDGRVTPPTGYSDIAYQLSLDDVATAQTLARNLGTTPPALAVRGPLNVAGRITGAPARWAATATLSSPGLAIEDVHLGVEASLALSRDGIAVQSLNARGRDGSVRAEGILPIGPGGTWNLEGELGSLRLDDLLARHHLPFVASLGGSFRVLGRGADPRLDFTVETQARAVGLSLPSSPDSARARLRITGSASREKLTISDLAGTVFGGSIAAEGSWARTTDAIAGVVEAKGLRLAWPPGEIEAADVTSTVQASIDVSGTLAAPSGRARLTASGCTWRGTPLPDVVLDASADGATLQIDGRSGEQSLLTGHLALHEPWPLHLETDLGALPVAQVLLADPRLAAARATLAVSGRATVDVPLASPAEARFFARLDSAAGELVQPWQVSPFTVTGSREAVTLEGFRLRFGDAELRAEGTMASGPESKPLTIRGAVPLTILSSVVPLDEAAGVVSLDLTVTGRPADPSVRGSVHVDGSTLRVGTLRFDDVTFNGRLADGTVTVDQASGRAGGGSIEARGSVGIKPPGGTSTLALQVRRVDLARLGARLGDLSALIDFDGALTAQRPALDALRGEGTLAALDLSASGRTLRLAAPVRWSVEGGRLTHSPAKLVGNGADLALDVQADAGVPTVRVGAAGTLDLAILTPLLGGDAALGGNTAIRASVERTPTGWRLDGDASLTAGRLALVEPALSVTDIAATVRATGRRIDLVNGTATIGDGHVRFDAHALTTDGGIETAAALHADRVPVEFPAGLRSRSSGDLTLAGASGRYRIGGAIVVHHATYELAADVKTQALDQAAATLAAIEGRSPLREKVELDIGVRLEDGLRVKNAQATVVIDGGLRAGGSLLSPELSGEFTMREGGTVRVSYARVRMQSGRVRLDGYPARPPEVDIKGATRVSGVNIDVALSGPLDDLHTTLSSPNRSDLGQGDLASLILTGRTASAAGSESGAIVGEQVASALGRALDRNVGGVVSIDVSPDDSLVALDADPSQRLNVRVPLSSWLAVVYSRSLEREALRWIVEVTPAADVKLRFVSDDDGSEAVDISHRFSLKLWATKAGGGTPRQRPRIGTVKVDGVSSSQEAELRSRMKLKPGAEFDYFLAEEAARKGQAWLASLGYRASSIDISETAEGAQTDLTVSVRRGPAVTIEWRGDDPGGDLRDRIRKEWGSFLPPDEYVARFARDATKALQARGYYGASVSPSVVPGPDSALVAVFDVHLGARGQGVDVLFRGNKAVSARTLSAALPEHDTPEFFELLAPEGHRRLSAALRVACAAQGFLQASVEPPEAAVDPSTNRLQVTIAIDEGPRAIVARLEVPDAIRQAPPADAPQLALRPGAPFGLQGLAADRARLLSWYRNEGYPDARVSGAVEAGAMGVAVKYVAVPGPRVLVGSVRTDHPGRLRRGVFDSAVVTPPGQPARARDLDESRERLSESQAFRSVDVRLEPREGEPGVRDVVVNAVERDGMNVEYALRYVTAGTGQVGETPTESGAGFQVGAGVELISPFAWAHRYRVQGLLGEERRLLSARQESATFFGRQWATLVSVYDDAARVPETAEFAQRVTGVTFQQTKRWRGATARRHDRLRMQWGYTFKRIRYVDLTTQQSLSGLRSSLLHTLSGDTRDSLTDPKRGVFWSVGTELSLRVLGSDVDYVRTYGQLFLYTSLGRRIVWAQAYRAGAAPGDDPLLLLENRFMAGGASTVRGFAENGLGPHTANGFALGGQAVVIFNQELRLPIWRRLWGGVFYDAGNVFGVASDVELRALRQSAGAGFRLMFPFGPIRFDWSRVLDAREGERTSRWLFSIGHAF